MKKNWIVYILLIPVCFAFYYVNSLNYYKHNYIQSHNISHPENLPDSNTAKIVSFGFTNIMADIYWLETIQYIGGNVISGEYKKYLYAIIDLITDLNPYFESPYIVGQLLLPSSEKKYDEFHWDDVLKNIHDGEKLWLKWVRNFCDTEKVRAIKETDDLQAILSDPKYKNPCKSYKIPYYLAYIYYFYLRDGDEASQYYKVVSAQDDAPTGARTLAAIMQGKGWDREKSLYMFLSLAKSVSGAGESCALLTEEIQRVYNNISARNIPLTGELLAQIQYNRDSILPELSEENEDEVLDDTKCTNFLAKATREINLMYLEQADAKYIQDHPGEVSAKTPETLLKKWYITFIPTDYQQYKDKDYWIVYEYNDEIKRFDYTMSY